MGVSCAVEEITERKLAEESLKRAHDEQERRVKDRTAELGEINRKLREEIEVRRRAEHELKLSAEIMENMDEGVCLVRASDGCLVFTNSRFDKIFGYETGELIGRHSAILNAPGEKTPKETADEILQELQETGIWSGDVHNIRKDETPFWTHASVSTFEHPQHGTVRVAVVEDITERKQVEKKLRFTQFAVDNTGDAAFWMGSDARLFFVNEAACRSLGYSREELLSKTVHDIDPCYPEETWSQIWADVKERKNFTFESCHRRKDGTLFPVEITVNYLHFDGQEYNCAFARDITERKRAEEEVRQLQEKLAHVARLSTMGEMATGLAHELNQPLAAISIYCGAGKRSLAETGSADPEKLRELFERLSEQAMRAGEIIRRLRGLVRKREPVRSRIDVFEPIQEVLHLLESDLRQSEVRVELQADHSNCVVIIDEIQIQQVLVNLIRNALDAMSETQHDRRTLKITTSKTADDLIEVAVRDTGKGIPVESADQVFDAFFSSKPEGMGMGLAISRTIIESHGGRLWITPNSDRGVTLHFTLPIAEEGSDDNGS